MSERPSQSLIESACMSFRHDFGLIPAVQAAVVMAEGESWLAAWRIGFAPYTSSPEAPGLGSGWAEPTSFVVDAACLAFDPDFRTRPFHEASAIRRGGMSWLQAWRHAFDGQPRRDGRIVRLAAPVDDHPQRPVIREADDPRVEILIALARDGVPPDVQELLIRGNPTAGVRPDVLGLILGLRAPIAADRP